MALHGGAVADDEGETGGGEEVRDWFPQNCGGGEGCFVSGGGAETFHLPTVASVTASKRMGYNGTVVSVGEAGEHDGLTEVLKYETDPYSKI